MAGTRSWVPKAPHVGRAPEARRSGRPPVFRGADVPAALQSGDHARIARWRRWKALQLTRERRPDLYARLEFGKADLKLLSKKEEEL